MRMSAICIGLFALLFLACKNESPQEDRKEKIPSVLVERVQKRQWARKLTFPATAIPYATITIPSKVAGDVQKVFKDEGDIVKENEILLQIDTRDLLLSYKQAVANLELAKASLDAQMTVLSQAEKDAKRAQELLQTNSITVAEAEKASTALEGAKAQVDIARAQVAMANAQVDLARRNLSYATVTSPVDGIVLKKLVQKGQVVAPSTPLFVVADTNPMFVEGSVEEKQVSMLQRGLEAKVTFDALPGREFSGVIAVLGPDVDERTRTVRVRVVLQNDTLEIAPGMSCVVEVMVAKRDWFAVPSVAIRDQKGEEVVLFLVSKEGEVFEKTLKPDFREGLWTFFANGFEEGDLLVVGGSKDIGVGSKVKIEEKSP